MGGVTSERGEGAGGGEGGEPGNIQGSGGRVRCSLTARPVLLKPDPSPTSIGGKVPAAVAVAMNDETASSW